MKKKLTILTLATFVLCLFVFAGCTDKCKTHEFTAAECLWNGDGTAEVVVTCGVCGETLSEEADVTETVTKKATCTENGSLQRTATVSIGGNTFNTFTRNELIRATGHSYGEAEFEWFEKNETQYCTASKVCKTCGDVYKETVTVSVAVTSRPSCAREGKEVYTAVFSEEFGRQTKTESVAKLPHTYGGAVSYVWNNHGCTATQSCVVCGDARKETVRGEYEEVIAATCLEDGLGRYTATFINPVFAQQTEDVVLPRQHVFGEPVYVWNAEHTECTATVECDNNDYTITETGSVSQRVVKENNCTEDGLRLYTAEFDTIAPTEYEEVIESKGGHRYGAVDYSWSADHGTCIAKMICEECGDKIKETAVSVVRITADATCTTDGTKEYKATFVNTAFSAQIFEETIARGHKEGAIVYEWNSEYTVCTAKIYCSECGEVYEEHESESMRNEIILQPTCSRNGTRRYTARFDRADLISYKTVELTVPHTFETPVYRYFWENDVLKCEASKTCSECGETVTETKNGRFVAVDLEGTTKKARYIVEFEDEDFGTQTFEITLSE